MSNAATLKLSTLKCIRKQDITGMDEPLLKVNGKQEWNGVMGKGDSKPVNISVDFLDFATVALEELDGGKGKPLGTAVEVPADRPETRTVDFKTSGAHYELTYTVTADAVAASAT